ncbi:MAG: hypothetical protein ACR2QE_07635 [Acidimicrobiales bacterium]
MTDPVPESKRRRRSRRETEELMLQAGVELALDQRTGITVGADPLPSIRVADVVERATEIVRRTDAAAPAITTGSIYPIWPDQSGFQAALLVHLLESDHLGIAPEWNELADYLENTTDDVHTVVASLARIGWDHGRANQRLLIVLSQGINLPIEHREAFAAHYDRVWEQLVPAFQLIANRFGYQLRPGRAHIDFVRTAVATLDGLIVQNQADSAGLDERDHLAREHDGDGWTLVGQATAALFDGWFELAPS